MGKDTTPEAVKVSTEKGAFAASVELAGKVLQWHVSCTHTLKKSNS